jgi:hypothetical protein
VRLLRSWLYNVVAVKDGGRTIVIAPTTLTIIEGGRTRTYETRGGEVRRWSEEDERSNTAAFMFIPEPGTTPEGYIREIRDGKLYVKMGPLTVELGEVYEV